MSKKFDYSFDMKGKTFHLLNEEKTPFSTNFDISTKSQNIRVVKEMGMNNDFIFDDENMEYNPKLKKNIKGKINNI